MAAKMSLCTISYTYEHYAGIDVEKLSNIIYEYVKKEFADFNPQVSEPGSDMEMPDHVDMLLCKKDGSIFYESDILRRAVNIPIDCQYDGLVLEIFIQNCDGTRYKKRYDYKDSLMHKSKGGGKSGMRKLKITKTFGNRRASTQEDKAPEDSGMPELRPQIDFHNILRQSSHDIRRIQTIGRASTAS